MIATVARERQTLFEIGLRTVAERAVVHFSALLEVQELHAIPAPNLLTFWVFSDEEEYDRDLMGRLIEKESNLMDDFPGLALDFKYLPMMRCPDTSECLPMGAKPLFKRHNG